MNLETDKIVTFHGMPGHIAETDNKKYIAFLPILEEYESENAKDMLSIIHRFDSLLCFYNEYIREYESIEEYCNMFDNFEHTKNGFQVLSQSIGGDNASINITASKSLYDMRIEIEIRDIISNFCNDTIKLTNPSLLLLEHVLKLYMPD